MTIKDQRAFFGQQTIGGGATIVKVDNVPTVLAFVASGTSYLGYALVNLVDTAFANSRVNGTRYSDVGFMTNFRFIARTSGTGLGEGDANDPGIKKERNVVSDLRTFVEKCAIPYQTLTGDTFDALDFGFPTLEAWDPKNWLYYDNVKFLEAAPGMGCKDFYAKIINDFNGVANKYERRSIEAMGMNPGTAGPALKAMSESVLAAPSNVAGPTSKMNGYTQYHLRASLDGVVAAARYADSFGVTGANAEAMNQSILSANAKMADITSQVRFLFSAQTLPKALHILIAILYAIFPFMLVVVAIRGYPEGLKVLYYFAGGMLSMELIKMSMALIHGIVSHITATNGAEILGAATGGNGQTVDYNNIVHGEAYFRYMAEQATLAADIGTAAMFMIPMVIATGQVKLLGSALGGAVTGHAPNATMQSANAEMAKANDAENRGADKVVEGYAAAAVMKGIEENNAAIASLNKMDLYNDFNKGQVGQQTQQIGSVAGYGSELKSAQDFAAVRSGGMFQGVQSAANMKSLGQEFESEQNFLNGKHSDGRSLARTLGNDATAKTIGSARGLMAGDFFNEHGDFDTAREGNIYRQGLENQARISANQTAGVGKLGEFTREQMNAIQYGAEAGALGQIAQGKVLMDVHNRGQAFQDSYSKTAYMNAHQSLSQQKGSAQAYDKETHGGDIKIAESMGRVSNSIALRGHAASIQAAGSEENIVSANAGDAAEKALTQAVSHGAKVALGARHSNGGLNLGSEATSGIMAQALKDAGAAVGNAENTISNFQNSLKTMKDKTDAEHNENYVKDPNSTATFARFAASNPMQRLEDIKNLPITAEGREGENWKKFQGGVILENQRLDDAKTQADNAFNAAQGGDFAEAGKLSSVQNYTLGAAGTTGTFNASGGFVQGGTQSGVSLSHNTQHSYSSGITASGGSLFAASATQMGFSADGFAAGASALSAVGQIASTASMFSRAAGGISSLMGGAGGDALMAAQQGVQRAGARVASAQSQLNWATEQAAGTHQRFGGAYAGMNAQQVGAESARLQMGIHDMNMRVGRLNGIKGKLISDGANKYDPTIKALDRQMRHLNTNINRDGMRVKYLGLRNNQINAEHNLAQAQLEESFARIKLSSL